MKICYTCKQEKDLSEFYKNRSRKDYYCPNCKECSKIYRSQWSQVERIQKQSKKYYENNKEKLNRISKEFRENNKEHYKMLLAQWKLKNKEKVKLDNKRHAKKYRQKNPNAHRLRNLLYNFLHSKSRTKNDTLRSLLGYGISEFTARFGSIPEKHHIDHKIPLSWFVKDVPANIANHLDNLQIIEGRKNISKSNKHHTPVSKEYLELCKPFLDIKYIQTVLN